MNIRRTYKVIESTLMNRNIYNTNNGPLLKFCNGRNNFIDENSSRVETYAYDTGNTNIVTFIFKDEQIEEEFQTLIIDGIKGDYKQYCDDNNITIDVVTEDI